MNTSIWILVAILALTWANVVLASSSYSSSESDEEHKQVDNDLSASDEGSSSDALVNCDPMMSYLVTAPDESRFLSLLKNLDKWKACRDCYEIKRRISAVIFLTSVQTTAECAQKLFTEGYLAEENSIQRISDSLPSLPVKLQKIIDGTGATYDRNDATDVTIFLLDTGVRTTHDEFQTNRARYFNDTVTPSSVKEGDVNGHGTSCASVAIGANIGVAQGATIQSVRVAGTDGTANADDVIEGLDLIKRWWDGNQGSKCVISYSMISLAISQTLDYAFGNITISTDCVVVVAAGNQGNAISTADACDYSPARLSNVITVGASRLRDQEDERFEISNYGPCVDIYAPGRNVHLAAPYGNSDSFYKKSSGTSFATPAVGGAAAMILSTTSLSPGSGETMTDLVRDILIETSGKGVLSGLPAEDAAVLPSINRLLNVADNTYYQ